MTWFKPFTQVRYGNWFYLRCFDLILGGFEKGDIAWFLQGELNVSYNCIDRHLPDKANKVAILWEGDEPGTVLINNIIMFYLFFANRLEVLHIKNFLMKYVKWPMY